MSHYDSFFFFNNAATTEIYTLSLHDALPISTYAGAMAGRRRTNISSSSTPMRSSRSEEHTSELQSRQYLVCRLLLEKKNRPILRGSPDQPASQSRQRWPDFAARDLPQRFTPS